MAARNVLEIQLLQKPATLAYVQVNHRVYNKEFTIWYRGGIEKYNILCFISVDCVWDKWNIGECSKTCGGGKKIITRAKKVEADHGGKECSGSSNITESCNVEECSGKIQNAQPIICDLVSDTG